MCLRNACLILFVLVSNDLRAASEEIPVLSVCEVLKDLDRYEGKSVIVVGRSSATDEGSWLTEGCALKVVRGTREFGAQISTTYVVSDFAPPPQLPHDFRWDKRLVRRKLEHVKLTTARGAYDQWAAMFGRLETRLPRRLFGRNSEAYANGFGHMSASPAQLVSPADGYLRIR